jgi:hypothetical protein
MNEPPSAPAAVPAPHVSPSLRDRPDGTAAFEVKFLLTEELAREVERRTAGLLALDPHTDPGLGNAYRTTTLYCDTPAFNVFFGTGPGRNRKHRLRRYGSASFAFLERKTKRGSEVSKRRSAVQLGEVCLLDDPVDSNPEWVGAWFRRRLAKYALRPVCRVSYQRSAYAGAVAEGPLRLTFDRNLRGTPADGWDLTPVEDGPDLLDGMVIVEFKFQGALPQVGKTIVEELKLVPGSASKYRRTMASTGLIELPRTGETPAARAAG